MVAVVLVIGVRFRPVVGGILRRCSRFVVTDGIALPVPVQFSGTPAVRHPSGIINIDRVLIKIERIRFQNLERLRQGSGAAARHLILECEVPLPKVAIARSRADRIREMDIPARHFSVARDRAPFVGQIIAESEAVAGIPGEELHQFIHRGDVIKADFHHIGVREVSGRGNHPNGGRGMQLLGRNRGHHVGKPVAAAVLDMESPDAAGQAVDGVIILIIIGGFKSAVVLPSAERDGAEGIAGSVVHNRHCIRKLAIKDAQLHPPDVLTCDGKERSRVVSVKPCLKWDNGRRGLLIEGGDGEDGLRVHPRVTACAVGEKPLDAHDVGAVIEGHRVGSAGVVPTRVVHRVSLVQLVIDPHLRQLRRQGVEHCS